MCTDIHTLPVTYLASLQKVGLANIIGKRGVVLEPRGLI